MSVDPAPRTTEATPALVIGAGVLMVAAHVVFRGWVAFGGWFYADDYTLLSQARRTSFGASYLGEEYSGHLMPAGRLIAWVVSESGTLNWPLAATITVALELLTCLAALWMFVSLFGCRWGALAPLALYLTTALTLPAFVWWGATLLQLATQLAFFWGVAAWVHYLRSRRLRWALLAYAGVAVGVVFDVKALVVLPVLAFMALAWFATGSPLARVLEVLRTYWKAAAVGLPVVAAYVGYFVATVDQPGTIPSWSLAGRVVADSAGGSLPVAVLGGPWRWQQNDVQPTQSAHAPEWAVQLSWVLLAAVVVYGVLRREQTLRAWGLLLLALAMDLGLLLTARATDFGPAVALEYRFFTDLAPGIALAVALAFLDLPGAIGSSRARARPLILVPVGHRLVAAAVAVVCVLGLISQTTYTRTFHGALGSREYVRNLEQGLRTQGEVDLLDKELPEAVSPSLIMPWNRVSVMARLVADQVSFPEASPALRVVDDQGNLQRARIQPGLYSQEGPRAGCGWLVTSAGLSVPLETLAFPWVWWMRVGYLASSDSDVVVSAGDSEVPTTVEAGLGELWVRVDGTFDSVRISGLADGVTLCVDTIEVGQPVPGGYL